MHQGNTSRPRTIQRVTQYLLAGSLLWLTGCAEETPPVAEKYDPTTTIETYTVTAAAHATDDTDEGADAEVAALVRFNNDLALDLFRYTQGGDNDVLATHGVNQLLAMSAAGAAGITAEEYRVLLDAFPDTSLELSALPMAAQRLNRRLGTQGDDMTSSFDLTNTARFQMGYRFRKDYLNTLRQVFDVQLTGAYFTGMPADAPYPPTFASPEVNLSWLPIYDESMTQLPYYYDLPSGTPFYYDSTTRLALLSETKLTNPWNLPVADRFEGLFEGVDGIKRWLPMLRWQGDFNVYEVDALRAVELPLGDSGKALLMITPAPGRYSDVFNNLSQHLAEMTPAMAMQDTVAYLPEFSISGYVGLQTYMKKLGLDTAFVEGDGVSCSTGCRADYSAINGLGYLYLSSPEQVSSVTVDGDAIVVDSMGTLEMLGAKDEPPEVWYGSSGSYDSYGLIMTSGGCSSTYIPYEGEPQVRPFLFVIRDTSTHAILYLGQVRSLEGRRAGSWQSCGPKLETYYPPPSERVEFLN